MKPTRSNPLFARVFGTSLTTLIVLSGSASAVEISYRTTATSTAEVTTAGNWVGGVAPGISDIAAWKTDGDPVTAGGQESRGGTLTISSPVSWMGFRHEDSSGAVILTGSPITLGSSGITEVRWEDLTINNDIILGTDQTWNNGDIFTLNGNLTGAFSMTKLSGGDLVFTNTTLGGGLVHVRAGRLVVNPASVGGTVTVQSLRTQRDIRMGNNGLLNIAGGSLGLSTAGGFWIQPSGTGTVGRLTSSSGALSLASVDTNGVVTTGGFTTTDHQIQVPIVDFNGSTPLAVTKSGMNSVSVTTANTYTGGTAVNGGRLQTNNAAGMGTGAVTVASGAQAYLNGVVGTYPNNFTVAGTGPAEAAGSYGAIRFNNSTISGNVTLDPAGTRIGGTGGTGTISGALIGSGPLEINSAATGATSPVTLSGNNSGYTGAVTVSQGSLTIANSFGGSISKATGATLINNGTINSDHTHTTGSLQGTGTFAGNVTLNGSTAADLLNIVPGAMNVTGDVTLAGTTTIRASGLGGTVPVLTYGGTLTGDATNLSLENAGAFRAGTHFDTDTPGVINLVILGAPVTWTNAAADMLWNTTSVDWDNAGSPSIYYQSDLVTFGDTGSGTVTLVGLIAPASIAINNTAGNDYTFTGSAGNVIAGTTGITKSGDGALTLATSNTFLGAVTLNGGITTLPARQVYTGGTTINSGAVLDLTGGGGQGGTIRGTVNVNGTGILRVSTGDATGWGTGTDRISVLNLSNGGTFEINNNANNQTLSNMAINLTGGNIVKGVAGFNGNIDLFNGSTSITTLASATTSVIAAGVNLGLRQPTTTITTALGITTSGIDLQIDASMNNSPANYVSPALLKTGPGTLCLNNPPAVGIGATGIYTGNTTIDGGTLLVGTGGTTGIIGEGLIIDNAALAFNRSDVVTVPNNVSGTGTLEQRGSGELNLTNGGTRSGDTIVTNGRLNIGTTAFTASTFRANPGGTLGAGTTAAIGTGTVPGLALSGGTAAFRASTSLADRIVVSGTNGFSVTAPSQIALTPAGALQTGDIIQLIDYDGTIGGSGFAGLSLTSTGNPHYAFTLIDNTTDTRVDATVVADTVIWMGTEDDAWDKATPNWITASNGFTSLYYDTDKVKFTDAAGPANTSIYLSEPVVPSIVEFDASIDYTLNGLGITGPTNLVKNNTGTATLANENTYTGTTTINAGTLQIGDGGVSGSLGTTAITNNSTLAYNTGGTITSTQAIAGTGQVFKRGDGQLTLSGANTFTGPIVVEAGTLAVGNAGALGTQANGITVNPGATVNLNGVTIPPGETITCAGTGVAGYAVTGGGTIRSSLVLTGNTTIGDATARMNIGFDAEPVTITGAYTLTKAGANFVWYRSPENGVGNTLAALVINEGGFGIETGNNGLNGVPITVNSLGSLSAWAQAGGAAATSQNNPIILNGGTLASDYDGETWTGPVTLTADSILGGAASAEDFTIAGVISQSAGPFGLTKTQVSTVTLAAVNTYTGNTTVDTGAITLADSGGLTFVIGANGVNNKITGAGTATLNGSFTLDLSGAATANGNSWTLVDTATKSFGATFTVGGGFTETSGVWKLVDGTKNWTFTESTGVLSLAVFTAESYGAYASSHGLSNVPSEDTDADGVSNGVEYFMNAATGITTNPGIVNGKITWPKNPAFAGTYSVQTSPDLVTWTNASSTEVGDTVEYTVLTGQGNLFIHLKVTPN
ncbi:MAG: autotransporter-associated beta strand repeat-containing protein [Verrucomicrobiota bacterium]